MTSPDGITWTLRTSAAENWNSVTYGNGLFVAVASGLITSQLVMTSPDGITWTSRNSAAANDWYSVTYGNGLFVAVSAGNTSSMTSGTTGALVVSGGIAGTTSVGTAAAGSQAVNAELLFSTATANNANAFTAVYGTANANVSTGWDMTATVGLQAFAAQTNITVGTAGGVVTGAAGYYVINGSVTGGGVITNQYGLYIEDMTAGTNDYGIAIAGADTAALWISSAVDTTDAANGIAFGLSRDTNLYRSAANVLYTDDRLGMGTWTADGDTAVYKDDPTGNIGIVTSDVRLKKDFEIIEGSTALTIIDAINAYKYHNLDDEDTSKKRYGVIAQELLDLAPELTFSFFKDDDPGETYYSVHYDKLSVLLLAGVKEQQKKIEDLTEEIASLASLVSNDEGQIMNSAVQFGLITLPGNPSTNSGLNIEAWDMQGKTLAYVQGILSSSGNWSIDEEGNLVVKKVTAQELCLDGVCIKKQQLEAILKLIGDNPSVLDAPIEVEPQVEEAVPVEVQIEEAPVVAEPAAAEPAPITEEPPVVEEQPVEEAVPVEVPVVEETPVVEEPPVVVEPTPDLSAVEAEPAPEPEPVAAIQ